MSETNRTENIKKLIEKVGLENTKKILGLKTIDLVNLVNIPINSEIALEILWELVSDKKIPRKYKDFNVYVDNMTGSFNWESVSDISIDGENYEEFFECYATPFWEGESTIPIDFNYYTIRNLEKEEDVFSDDRYDETVRINTSSTFKNIEELLVWYRDFYLPRTYEVVTQEREIRREKSGLF